MSNECSIASGAPLDYQTKMTRLTRPVVFMRGGTSKGLFFHERDLPPAGETRDRLLLGAMGSPDPYGRQLNGMGGGLSSLSKIIIVSRSQRADADIDYLHGQVAIDQPVIDYSANCGNLSSAVGPFALDEQLIAADGRDETTVRLHNLNTDAIIHARVPLRNGAYDPGGDFAMPGVAGSGARIALEYLADESLPPLFPTGQPRDDLNLGNGQHCQVTMAISAMPCIFVRAEDVGLAATMSPSEIEVNREAMTMLEIIRCAAAVKMGLAADTNAVAIAAPKIGIVAAPADYTALDGSVVAADASDILVRMISVGQPHKAVPLTAGMCLAASVLAKNSVPNACSRPVKGPAVRIGSPSGVLTVGATLNDGEPAAVRSTLVYATARRLMEGRI